MAASGNSACRLVGPIRAEVAVDYEPQSATQLKLRVGELVHVCEKHESGWWGGHKDGEETTGWFPCTAVRCSQSIAGRRSSVLAYDDEHLGASDPEKERLREDLASKDAEITALKDQVRQLEEKLETSRSCAVMSGGEVRPVRTANRLSVSEDLAAHSYIEGRSSLGTELAPPVVARRLFDHTMEEAAPTAIQLAPAIVAQSSSSTVVAQPPRLPAWRVNPTPSHGGSAVATTHRATPTMASGRRSVESADSGAGSAATRAPAVGALVSAFESRSSSLSRPKEPSPHRTASAPRTAPRSTTPHHDAPKEPPLHRPIASNRTASAPRTSGAPLAAAQTDAPGSHGRGGAPPPPTEVPTCVVAAEEGGPSAPVVFGMSPMLRSGASPSRRGLEDSRENQCMDQKGATRSVASPSRRGLEHSREIQCMDQKGATSASQESMVQQRIRQLRGGC